MRFCADCDAVLTNAEAFWYGRRCERCERLNLVRHQQWLAGRDDSELEKMYSGGNQ